MADEAPKQEHYPPFVTSDDDRRRWDLAVANAAQLLDEPEASAQVWQAARTLYHSDIPT